MASVHSYTLGWNDAYGASISRTKDLTDTAETRVDEVIETGVTGQASSLAILIAKTSGIYFSSNANVTMRVNGANEIVLITPASASPGDTFRLIFGGNTTANITFTTATGATVQAALEALASIGAGNVSVAGSAGGPWTITFINSLGLTNVGAVTVGAIATTSGATITPSVVLNGAAAAQTITLLAGIPLLWFTGCGLAYPFTVDTVTMYYTNTSGQQATVNARVLFHP